MGRKVHPKIYRVGRSANWLSKWFYNYRKKKSIKLLEEDFLIRKFLYQKLTNANIDRIEIERSVDSVKIIVYTARPGFVIGRSGQMIEKIKEEIQRKILKDKKEKLDLVIREVKEPNLSARVVLENMIASLEKRVPYRRVLKKNIEQVRKAKAKGVKLIVSGRLDGVEIARQETLSWGKIPLHTIRADIDYAQGTAQTTYGLIGVKVWIYRGDVFTNKSTQNQEQKT